MYCKFHVIQSHVCWTETRCHNHICRCRYRSVTGPTTRTSNFSSSSEFACLNFGKSKFIFEINDHMIEFCIWCTFELSKNLLLVQFIQMKVDQKRNFEQYINHVMMNSSNPNFCPLSVVRIGPKEGFRTVWWWIKSKIRSHDNLFRSNQKWNGIHIYHSTISYKFCNGLKMDPMYSFNLGSDNQTNLVPFDTHFDPSTFAEMNKRVLPISEQREF